MKSVSGLFAKHLQKLEALFSRDWIADFSSFMEFIQTQFFDHIVLSEEQIAEAISYLKKIHESESHFHTESLTVLRKEQDLIQKRVNQMYDDKLDRLIDEKMYLDKVRGYKARQAEIIEQMARHEKADHNFYVTANIVMNLARSCQGNLREF